MIHDYNYMIDYHLGKANVVADAISCMNKVAENDLIV
jgi:hypothetical protein